MLINNVTLETKHKDEFDENSRISNFTDSCVTNKSSTKQKGNILVILIQIITATIKIK